MRREVGNALARDRIDQIGEREAIEPARRLVARRRVVDHEGRVLGLGHEDQLEARLGQTDPLEGRRNAHLVEVQVNRDHPVRDADFVGIAQHALHAQVLRMQHVEKPDTVRLAPAAHELADLDGVTVVVVRDLDRQFADHLVFEVVEIAVLVIRDIAERVVAPARLAVQMVAVLMRGIRAVGVLDAAAHDVSTPAVHPVAAEPELAGHRQGLARLPADVGFDDVIRLRQLQHAVCQFGVTESDALLDTAAHADIVEAGGEACKRAGSGSAQDSRRQQDIQQLHLIPPALQAACGRIPPLCVIHSCPVDRRHDPPVPFCWPARYSAGLPIASAGRPTSARA